MSRREGAVPERDDGVCLTTLRDRRAGPVKGGVRRQAPSRLREPLKAVMEPAAATPRATIFANLVFSVYICIGIVTGNSERVDNPLKSFLIRAPSKSRSLGGFLFFVHSGTRHSNTVLDVFSCVLLFSDGQFDGPI